MTKNIVFCGPFNYSEISSKVRCLIHLCRIDRVLKVSKDERGLRNSRDYYCIIQIAAFLNVFEKLPRLGNANKICLVIHSTGKANTENGEIHSDIIEQ